MGFFPDPRQQGEIKFLILKKIPYKMRMFLIIMLFIVGFILELAVNFWLGLCFFFAATLLGLVKGFSAKSQLQQDIKWDQVTPDEYKKVREKEKQLKKWDRDSFDISNPLGGCLFFIIIASGFAFWLYFMIQEQEVISKYLFWNGLVIIIPHWFSGIRSYLKKAKLIIKIDMIEKVIEHLVKPSDIHVLPMLATRKSKNGGKRVPEDARLMIRFIDAPDTFLGMQIQVSINDVQGTFYPYLYCVLIAKKKAKFFDKQPELKKPPANILFEKKGMEDVDVIVIRQYTTKTSGYSTKPKQALAIVDTGLALARKLLGKKK
ncbi:MAG: hypothetical protein KKH98_02200 [Spirochaetes bacterium]|nr:hypothetical protein [Spirochaetota bacterium]